MKLLTKFSICFFITLLMVIYFSCNNEKRKIKNFSNYKLSVRTQKVIDSLNYFINDLDRIHPLTYDQNNLLCKSLSDNASLSDLIFLTKHTSPKVRCAAFNILSHRNYDKIKNIFYEHLNDKDRLMAGEGDIVGEMTVTQYMLDQLHPASWRIKNRLTRKEYDSLYKVIPRTY